MGSYAAYCGSYNIPEDKQAVFVKQMLRVLDLGGMMETTEVQLFDQRLELLQPVREIKAEKIYFHFNYFEDRGWKTAGFTPKDTYLWTEKIGDAEFSDTITAAYMLYELYDPEYGFAIKDCDFVEASQTIGWLNHILGTRFSIGKRANLWECIEQDALSSSRCEIRKNALEDLVPRAWRNAVGGTDLTDIMFIINGMEHLSGFIKLLNEIDAYYWHLFPFESMLYDFVEHISQKEYSAAIELLRQIADAEENRKIGKVIYKSRYSDMKSKNATGNAGRIQIKRLYAVLANKQLRQKYFGF